MNRKKPPVMCPECAWGKVSFKSDEGIKYSCGTYISFGQIIAAVSQGSQCRQYQKENA